MRKNVAWKNIILVCIIGLFLAGCGGAAGSKILMKQGKYTPQFRSADYSRYKGKKLVMAGFANQAGNTKAWSYNSADNKYMYEGDAQLESYYWYCFQKAFRHIGVNVVDYYGGGPRPYGYHHGWGYGWGYGYEPPPEQARAARGVPEFGLTLTSLTDQEFSLKVYLYKNGETKLEKDFTVKMSAAGTNNPADLEKRSYRLVDLAFTTIMKDKDFQRVF